MNKNEKIVFMGTPLFAASILEGLIEAGFSIVGVVCQPDKEYGRKRELRACEVKETALKHGIPVFSPIRIRNDYQEILDLQPDLIITSAYGQIIPKELLVAPKYGCINTHGSLLPAYRGASPVQTAIMNGDDETGITLMYMNEKMDEGDIIAQKRIDIDIHDTNTTLFHKLSDLSLKMLKETLPLLFAGQIEAIPQDPNKATYCHKLDKEIEHIAFNEDARTVYDHIRALLEEPGCYFKIADKKYKIEKAFYSLAENSEPGRFKGLEKDYLRIDASDGFIMVYQIRPEGKNSMDAKAFYNGVGRRLMGEHVG